jgi:hypothetical protein
LLWFVAELPPGTADHRPAGGSEELIALTVLLKCGDSAMHAATVSFDDQASIAPEEVRDHRDAIDNEVTVHLRRRQPRSPVEAEKPFLELATGQLFARIVEGDRSPQSPHPATAPAPGQQLVYSPKIELPLDFGLPDRMAKAPIVRRGEIEQRAGEAGAGDPINLRPIL